jgi:hypothetical protein
LSLLEDPKYKLKHDEYHNQGLTYEQLRNTDVLLGTSKLAIEDDATATFRKEVWDKFGSKKTMCTNDPDVVNHGNELFNKRRVRLMEEYKDDNGNSVWGSIGDETEITKYICDYIRSTSNNAKRLARKKMAGTKEDSDESDEDDVGDEDY